MKRLNFRIIVTFLTAAFILSISAVAIGAPPIKVGLLVPLSGVYAVQGELIRNGAILAFEQGGEIAGRKVEVIVEDDEAKPDIGVTKWRKLVEKDGVHFTAGVYSSAVGLAVRDMADKYQVPHLFIGGASAMEFLTTKKSAWVRHANYGGVINDYATALYMFKEKKFKKIISMVPDYAWGWSVEECVKAVAKKYGAQVVQTIRTPFPMLDFSPYIAKFSKDADAIYCVYAGTDGPRFIKQAKRLGVNMSDVWSSATFMPGDFEDAGRDALGGNGAIVWLPDVNTPENEAFKKSFKARFGRDAGTQAACAYTSILAATQVLKRISGKVEDKRAFLEGWYNLEPVKGPIVNYVYDKNVESADQSMFVFKVVERDGKPYNKIVAQYDDAKTIDMLRVMGLAK